MTDTSLDIIGVVGFCLYVSTYTRLTLGFLSGDSIQYFCLNLTAASFVMLGLMASFNLASAMIQGFFITMSIVGILIRLMRPPSGPQDQSQNRAAV